MQKIVYLCDVYAEYVPKIPFVHYLIGGIQRYFSPYYKEAL